MRDFVFSVFSGSVVSTGFAQVAANASAPDWPQVLTVGGAFTVLLLFVLRSYEKLMAKNFEQQATHMSAYLDLQQKTLQVIQENTSTGKEIAVSMSRLEKALELQHKEHK